MHFVYFNGKWGLAKMGVSKSKGRITITCSSEQIAKLDAYATKMGMNRSALCAYFIGQGLLTMDKAYGVLDKFADSLSDDMLSLLEADGMAGK